MRHTDRPRSGEDVDGVAPLNIDVPYASEPCGMARAVLRDGTVKAAAQATRIG
jgi:hypothetical protein